MQALIERLTARYALGECAIQRPNLAFADVDADTLRPLLIELRDREAFTHLVLLTAVDWIESGTFQLTYLLNNRRAGLDLGLRLHIDRKVATAQSIHDLWPTAATYQRELREMFGIDFPGSPGIDAEFMLEGWTDMPPYRREFDSLAYSQQTYAERGGRVSHDPRVHMHERLYPEG